MLVKGGTERKWRMISLYIRLIHNWYPFECTIRCLIIRSRNVSKPRDLYSELYDRSDIWQARRQQCCLCACQISKRYDNLNHRFRGYGTAQNLAMSYRILKWDLDYTHEINHIVIHKMQLHADRKWLGNAMPLILFKTLLLISSSMRCHAIYWMSCSSYIECHRLSSRLWASPMQSTFHA